MLNARQLLQHDAEIATDIIPWINRDLTRESFNFGQFRLADTPLMFLVRNRCLLDPEGNPFMLGQIYDCGDHPCLYDGMPFCRLHDWEPVAAHAARMRKSDFTEEMEKFDKSRLVPNPDSPYLGAENSLDRDRLRKILARQLGSRIDEFPSTDHHFRKYRDDPENAWRFNLYVALRKIGLGLCEEGDAMLDAMNRAMSDSIVPENIKPSECGEILDSDAEIHNSFENSFLIHLLERARRIQIVPASRFGWVRAFDRSLWYALSSAGRRCCFAEGAGPMFHYQAERLLGKRLGQPCLDPAIDSFEREMAFEGWLPATKGGEE